MKSDIDVGRTVRDLCACYKFDLAVLCCDLCMDWEEIGRMAEDPLCAISAHGEPSDAE